jgi:hypothetical protein
MKLYRCKTPTDHLCRCGTVARSLRAAGIEFEVERVPLSAKPDKRRQIIELTGQPKVPVLAEDDGPASMGQRGSSNGSPPARSAETPSLSGGALSSLSTSARPSGNSCAAACCTARLIDG